MCECERESTNKPKKRVSVSYLSRGLLGGASGLYFLEKLGFDFGFNWRRRRGHWGGVMRYSNINLGVNFNLLCGRVYISFIFKARKDKFQTVSIKKKLF